MVKLDLTDYDDALRVLNEYDVRTVFHLAAQTIVGIANRSPLSTWESNIRGTYTLLEACRGARLAGRRRVEEIVVASSDKAYGDQEVLPYREDTTLLARYPYDVSKACTDMIARSYAVTYEHAGGREPPGQRLRRGRPELLAPGPRHRAGAGQRAAPVVRSDGSPERDWIYVKDAVEAYLRIAGSLSRTEFYGRPWNAGSGTAVSVLDVVADPVRGVRQGPQARRPGRRDPARRDRPPGAGLHRDQPGAGLEPPPTICDDGLRRDLGAGTASAWRLTRS